MQLLNGRTIARDMRAALKPRAAAAATQPGIAAVLVGDDPASHLYVNKKERACSEVGIRFQKKLFSADVPEADLLAYVKALNADDRVHAILVQLPLPDAFDEDAVINAIDPRKDVDGFQEQNVRAFIAGQENALTPVLVKAIERLLTATHVPLAGKTAAIRSNSSVFAAPIIAALNRLQVTARYVAPRRFFKPRTNDADILIVALGQPGAIVASDVKKGAIVIDVGTTRLGDRVVGDVDADAVAERAAWLTPVPGGVGPVTVAALLENVVELAERRDQQQA